MQHAQFGPAALSLAGIAKAENNFREDTESQLTAKATASEQPGQTARTQTTKSLTKTALLPQCRP
jgi:hypothetical protein